MRTVTEDRQERPDRAAPFLLPVHLTRSDHLGVKWNRAPGFASSSAHNEPSGPSSTSRMRCPKLQRSAALAPPCPSKMMRLSDWVTKPVMKPLPSHSGNVFLPT